MQITAATNLRFAVIAIGAVAATSVMGQVATYPNLEPWYAGLSKPIFTPPNWVFAPVWTSLYALMAFAFWRILRTPETTQRRTAIILFALLLVANAAWSWMFFGANSPILGLINIGPQLAIIGATIAAFWILDRAASLLLVPLATWVAFAAVLNFSIWRLNA
jgi:tryptophan-rich sensory protein